MNPDIGIAPRDTFVTERHEKISVVLASMVMGTAAYFGWQLMPILLAGLMDANRLSEAGVGQVAMIETIGLAIGSIVGPTFLRDRIRLKVALACILFIGLNLAIIWASSVPMIMVQRGVSGLIAGFIAAAANLILAHNSRPGFVSGLMIAFIAAPQAVAGYLLPTIVIPQFGINAAFVLIAFIAFIALCITPFLVDRVEVGHEEGHGRVARTPALFAAITAIVLQMGATGAAWNYLGVLAGLRSIASHAVGTAFSGSLLVSTVALLIGAWLSLRLVANTVLIVGALLQAVAAAAIVAAFGPTQFVLAVCSFGAFASMQAFMVNELVRIDPTRKMAVLVNPFAQIGMGLGPLVASFIVSDNDIDDAYWGAVILFLVAAALYVIARVKSASRAHRAPSIEVTSQSGEAL